MKEEPRKVFHTWHHLAGIDDARTLASPDMPTYMRDWERRKASLNSLGILKDFQDRLARKWSIETGVLERLYEVSRGLTITLVDLGFDASLVSHGEASLAGEELVSILQAHRDGLDMVMDLISGARLLSTGWIRELHALMTRHQHTYDAVTSAGQRVKLPLNHGAYKTLPNNPTRADGAVHEYCPPEHVASEMERMIQFLAEIPAGLPEVRAAFLHHRFTQIHPFEDGNGRVARALASFEFIRAGLLPLLVEPGRKDSTYIPALEAADRGDLGPLVQFFSECVSRVLLLASAEAESLVGKSRDLGLLIRAGRKKVEERASETRERSSRRLEAFAALVQASFNDLSVRIRQEIPSVQARIFAMQSDQAHWYRAQLVQLARHRQYWIDLSSPRTWVKLRLQSAAGQTSIIASIHTVSGSGGATWVLDIFTEHGAVGRDVEDRAELCFPDIDPLLLSLDEGEATQQLRVSAWLARAEIAATAQWIHYL